MTEQQRKDVSKLDNAARTFLTIIGLIFIVALNYEAYTNFGPRVLGDLLLLQAAVLIAIVSPVLYAAHQIIKESERNGEEVD